MMCCTALGYIIFSLRNLKFYEDPGAGDRITQRPLTIAFMLVLVIFKLNRKT